ncbi:hypothetical protein AKJ16_DCAP03112 [Drosera capensis]
MNLSQSRKTKTISPAVESPNHRIPVRFSAPMAELRRVTIKGPPPRASMFEHIGNRQKANAQTDLPRSSWFRDWIMRLAGAEKTRLIS